MPAAGYYYYLMDIGTKLQSALENHRKGKFDLAEEIYRDIISVQSDHFYALHFLGILYTQLGKYDLAISHIKKAIRINPSDADAYYNLGIALQGKGDFAKAINSYEKSLQFNPANADAYVNLGTIFKDKGKLDDAVSSYQKALQLNPDLAAALNNLGVVLKEKGLLSDAIELYQKALRLYPDSPDVLHNLGVAFQEKGQLDDAVDSYEKALRLRPGASDILFNLATALMEQGKQDQAKTAFDELLANNPDSFKYRFAHCIAQLPILHPDPLSIQRSRKLYGDELMTLQNTMTLKAQKDIEDASKAVGIIQPFYLAYQGCNDVELQRTYGELVCKIMGLKYPHFAQLPSVPSCKSGESIRVGFVSGYFYNHSVWKIPTRGWVENLDKSQFELYGYYTWKKKDDETALARRYFKRFVEDVYSPENLCSIIRNDNLHILVFPEIGMDPISLKLASLSLAPVQCASWGHPTTTGLPSIDYYLSSDLMEPEHAASHYTEKLIRLPNLSMFYSPIDMTNADLNRGTLGLKPDSILYHCCQSPFKYLPQYDDVFPRIAREVGNSRFLFSSHPKSNWITEQFLTRLKKAFKKYDLAADDFIVLLPFLDVQQYNSLYHLSDVFLDPIGWSGCNSALEAISCNLPVVTFPGELMRTRDSMAILKMMDVKETIAAGLDEYVSLAAKLGKDAAWREDIAKRISVHKHRLYHDKTCISYLEDFFRKAAAKRLA
jgi:protein O-GlcNAc transferase